MDETQVFIYLFIERFK